MPGAIIGFIVAVWLCLRFRRWRSRKRPGDPLDAMLFTLTPRDRFSVRNLLESLIVLGRSGSGKSTSSGRTVMRALVQFPLSSLLLIAAKPEDRQDIIGVFAEAGRLDDLIIFEPGGPWRFNIFDYMLSMGADAAAIAECFITIGESLAAGQAHGSGEDQFFRQQNRLWIYNAVVILRIALGRITAPDLYRFINSAATCREEQKDERWQQGFHNQCLKAAYLKMENRRGIEADDWRLAHEDWVAGWPAMADRTRTSILAGMNGILHAATTGIVRELCAGATNCSPDLMLDQGKSILINMPVAKYGPSGAFVAAAWRYQTQKAVLQREAKAGDFISVIWMDEFQQTVNSFDHQYLAQCRSHLGCMVCLTQSIPGLVAALKGPTAKAQAEALVGAFATKVFHSCDPVSAEYGSSCIGRAITNYFGGSMAPVQDLWDALGMGTSRFTGSVSEHMESIVQPSVFMNGLRTGGPVNNLLCDAIVVRSGEPFSNGQNFIQVTFSQR